MPTRANAPRVASLGRPWTARFKGHGSGGTPPAPHADRMPRTPFAPRPFASRLSIESHMNTIENTTTPIPPLELPVRARSSYLPTAALPLSLFFASCALAPRVHRAPELLAATPSPSTAAPSPPRSHPSGSKSYVYVERLCPATDCSPARVLSRRSASPCGSSSDSPGEHGRPPAWTDRRLERMIAA